MKLPCTLVVATLLVASNPASAASTRAWVSGHGTDAAGCGAPTAPCRSLQYTHDNVVGAGGEIDILDPAGYGAILITKSISIINDGVGTAGVQASAGGNAVTITAAPTDLILLRGLSIEGLGQANEGVRLTNGASLAIEDSSVDRFSIGIFFEPTATSALYLSNTSVTNSGVSGIIVVSVLSSGTESATLEHVEAAAGQFGLIVESDGAAQVKATLVDSVITGMGTEGVRAVAGAGGSPVFMVVRNSVLTNNNFAVAAESGGTIDIGDSNITGNTVAFFIPAGGAVGSYGTNITEGNVVPPVTPTALLMH